MNYWYQKQTRPKSINVNVSVAGLLIKNENIDLKPVIYREFDFVSHSHNDIGYSDLQEYGGTKTNPKHQSAMDLIKKISTIIQPMPDTNGILKVCGQWKIL